MRQSRPPGASGPDADLHGVAWDARPKVNQEAKLIADLRGRPASPLVAARLAQLHLRVGRKDLALQALSGAPQPDALVRATRLAVLAALGDARSVLLATEPERSDRLSGPEQPEARARALHARASALWTLHRYGEAASVAQAAATTAAAGGLTRFAKVCALLAEDCRSLQHEVPPAERERVLRARLEEGLSTEARLEASINLMQLMYRSGRYDAALDLARTLPEARLGRQMRAIGLIATGQAQDLDWAALDGTAQYGRLHAVLGAMRLDAPFVLAGPPPDPRAALSARHHAEWSVSYAWALLVSGDHPQALRELLSPFIHRSEWDLRLVRDLGLLELFARTPQLVEEQVSPLALVHEALWLARERVSSRSVLMTRFPRVTPHAALLLLAAPGGCAPLAAFAREGIALVNGLGLVLGGVTRTQASAVRRLLTGERHDEAPLVGGARRSARTRLKATLAAHGHPALVSAADVLGMLERLAALADEPDQAEWQAAVARYAQDNALLPSG